MRVKAIIFDKDGTLLDFDAFWISVAVGAISDVIKSVKADDGLTDKFLEALGTDRNTASRCGILCSGTYTQIAEAFYKVLKDEGINIEYAELKKIVVNAFHDNIQKGRIVPTCDNICAVFYELKSRGIKAAVVTTDDRFVTDKCLEELGIKKFFCRIYTDDGVNPSKPDPYYISRFCEEEGLDPSDILMVGDTRTDMKFAQNGGIRSVGVAADDKGLCLLEGSADVIIHDISQIFEILE